MPSDDPHLQAFDLALQLLKLPCQSLQCRARQFGKLIRLEVDGPQRGLSPSGALGRDNPVLAEMAAQRIDQHGTLPDHKIAGFVQHQHGLLSLRLHRNEAHRRPRYRLHDRLRIGGVGLAPLHVSLHVCRRHQPDLVTQCHQLARPMMRRGASLHANQTRRQRGEEGEHLPATELPANYDSAISAHAVNLKYILRQIEPDDRNPFHDPLLDVTSLVTTTSAKPLRPRPSTTSRHTP
jgi:hypothetical protein